jgi:YebC/PmpR family DNA-binding regulatory protein
MGRAFEYRKARKLKRWGNMARVFTKLGKEITIAVKSGGSDPETNPRLRILMQTAKKENMPKENVERAVKKATSKDFTDYKEMNYEGYGPYGIAVFVETATDNTTRTVANVRSYFNKHGGSLGTTGSLEFLFDHKCVFHTIKKDGVSLEYLELELIDYGVDEAYEDENEIILYGEFAQNSAIQKFLEDNGYEITSSEFIRIPKDLKDVTAEQREAIDKLIEKIEEDDDVQNVFHNMREEDDKDDD